MIWVGVGENITFPKGKGTRKVTKLMSELERPQVPSFQSRNWKTDPRPKDNQSREQTVSNLDIYSKSLQQSCSPERETGRGAHLPHTFAFLSGASSLRWGVNLSLLCLMGGPSTLSKNSVSTSALMIWPCHFEMDVWMLKPTSSRYQWFSEGKVAEQGQNSNHFRREQRRQ